MGATLSPETGTTTWTIDPAHTNAEFAVKHMMISTVKGHFADVTGTIVLDENDLENSHVEVSIPTVTVDTRSAQRDGHLRSADFFNTDEYPAMVFASKHVTPKGDGQFEVLGDLTIKDVTREVTLEVSDEGRGRDPWGNETAAFTASTKIDRTDWGLGWNAALEAGGVLVSNEIRIQLDVQAVRG
jgi:polyisoprenoid-binding protein YceI